MRRATKFALQEVTIVVVLLVLLGACFFVPGACDPSRNPELYKSL